MTADHSSDSGRQRTVAELLEQYGGSSGGGGRRRRRADDGGPSEQPAPELPGFGNGLRSGGADPLTADGSDPVGYRAASQDAGGYGPSATGSNSPGTPVPGPATHATGDYGLADRPDDTGVRRAEPVGWRDDDLFPNTALPPPAPGAAGAGSDVGGSAGAYPSASGTGGYPVASGMAAHPSTSASASAAFPTAPARSPDQPTEQFTRFGQRSAQPMDLTGPIIAPVTGSTASTGSTPAVPLDAGPTTGQVSPVDLFGDDDDDSDGAPAESGRTATKPPELADVPAGPTDGRDRPTSFLGWLAQVGQWVLGAVLGALLWVGFQYLWLRYPLVALVAAVVATAGLVLLVRAIRRSDDLQTTMLAVLVGLVVTISPAVLLLAVR